MKRIKSAYTRPCTWRHTTRTHTYTSSRYFRNLVTSISSRAAPVAPTHVIHAGEKRLPRERLRYMYIPLYTIIYTLSFSLISGRLSSTAKREDRMYIYSRRGFASFSPLTACVYYIYVRVACPCCWPIQLTQGRRVSASRRERKRSQLCAAARDSPMAISHYNRGMPGWIGGHWTRLSDFWLFFSLLFQFLAIAVRNSLHMHLSV